MTFTGKTFKKERKTEMEEGELQRRLLRGVLALTSLSITGSVGGGGSATEPSKAAAYSV